jgi:hypothetical protein
MMNEERMVSNAELGATVDDSYVLTDLLTDWTAFIATAVIFTNFASLYCHLLVFYIFTSVVSIPYIVRIGFARYTGGVMAANICYTSSSCICTQCRYNSLTDSFLCLLYVFLSLWFYRAAKGFEDDFM